MVCTACIAGPALVPVLLLLVQYLVNKSTLVRSFISRFFPSLLEESNTQCQVDFKAMKKAKKDKEKEKSKESAPEVPASEDDDTTSTSDDGLHQRRTDDAEPTSAIADTDAAEGAKKEQ